MKPSTHTLTFTLESQPEGGYTITCPQIPELNSQGENASSTLRAASMAVRTIYNADLMHADTFAPPRQKQRSDR